MQGRLVGLPPLIYPFKEYSTQGVSIAISVGITDYIHPAVLQKLSLSVLRRFLAPVFIVCRTAVFGYQDRLIRFVFDAEPEVAKTVISAIRVYPEYIHRRTLPGKYIQEDSFLLTYGDGLANIDLNQLVSFHKAHGKIGTVSGVHMPSRFGKLVINTENCLVERFTEKPLESGTEDYINGGFFMFNREFFRYVDIDKSCVLERKPLEQLAKDGELAIFQHNGYWQCMDTYRDWLTLEELWQTGEAPWKSTNEKC